MEKQVSTLYPLDGSMDKRKTLEITKVMKGGDFVGLRSVITKVKCNGSSPKSEILVALEKTVIRHFTN
jgi:hypothetical protein